jgi:hypothetical protein
MGLGSILKSAVHVAENVFHKAENNVKKTVKTIERTAEKDIKHFVGNVASQVAGNNPVTNFVHTAQDLQKAIAPKSKGIFGKILDAGNKFVGKVNNFGNNLIDKGKNFISKVNNFGSKALDFGKKVVNEVVNRSLDIGRSGLNIITEGLGGLGRSLFEGGGKALSGLGKALNPAPLGKLFSGDVKGAWQDFKGNLTEGAKKISSGLVQGLIQGPVDTVVVALQNGVSAIQTAVGLEPAGRGLNNEEKAELKKVYGNSIDLDKIRLKEGNIGLNNFLAPHTIGNTIYIPKGWLDSKDANYKQNRNELLVHETAHTWQYQNGGTDYIGASLWNQAKGFISGGDRGAAYDFESAIKAGKSWKELNPEQQAHLIDQAYGERMFDDPNARFVLKDGTDITDFTRKAIEEMLKGKGAA